MSNSSAMAVFSSMRLPFLTLPPVCVFLGLATVLYAGGEIDLLHLGLALAGALAAHVAVNALNEYDDFKSGLDFKTERTPFSGGSGFLPANPGKARVALITGVAAVLFTILVGVYFSFVRGWEILPLGVLGLITIVAYTRWITSSPIICLIAPGLGFGPLMVLGTAFALSGRYTMTALLASLVPFCLVSNLLLINQFPDVSADRDIGRRHLPITIGRQKSALVFTALLVGAWLLIIGGVISGHFPALALLALASIIPAVPLLRGVFRHADSIPELVPFLGINVLVVLLTPVLLATGIILGR